MHMQQRALLHNCTPKSLQLKPLRSAELIGVFFQTQVDNFPSSDRQPCSPVFREVVFLEVESCRWFIFQPAAAEYRDTEDLLFSLLPLQICHYSLLSKTFITQHSVYPVGEMHVAGATFIFTS